MTQRFSRQAKIGWWNQSKLANTNVILVGCGGIGTWTAIQLTMLGIRRLILVDPDTVDESNLNRQMFYEEDIGKPKVEALREKLTRINSKIKIDVFEQTVQSLENNVYKNVDFVFDCLDNIKTREYLDNLCFIRDIPFIHSACSPIIGEVQLIVKNKTKFRLNYPKGMKKAEDAKSCADFDPAVCTTNMIVASLQVDKFLDYLIRGETKNQFIHYIRGTKLSYGDN